MKETIHFMRALLPIHWSTSSPPSCELYHPKFKRSVSNLMKESSELMGKGYAAEGIRFYRALGYKVEADSIELVDEKLQSTMSSVAMV